MDVRLRSWRPKPADVLPGKVSEDGTVCVGVQVPQDARYDTWAYSDHDKAVLVSFVVILPAAQLAEFGGDSEALRETFGIDVDVESSFSSQLVSVVDLEDA